MLSITTCSPVSEDLSNASITSSTWYANPPFARCMRPERIAEHHIDDPNHSRIVWKSEFLRLPIATCRTHIYGDRQIHSDPVPALNRFRRRFQYRAKLCRHISKLMIVVTIVPFSNASVPVRCVVICTGIFMPCNA